MIKLKKKSINKRQKIRLGSTWFNLSNSWLDSWDCDSLIKSNAKKIMKFNSQSTQMMNDEIEKKKLQKRIK